MTNFCSYSIYTYIPDGSIAPFLYLSVALSLDRSVARPLGRSIKDPLEGRRWGFGGRLVSQCLTLAITSILVLPSSH